MDKVKGSGDDVKTINMLNSKMSKQLTPLKIILDNDSEIRATNFHGTTKTGRTYISPQIVFVRATGRQKSIDISFLVHQLQPIISSLVRIISENDEYFDDQYFEDIKHFQYLVGKYNRSKKIKRGEVPL